MKLRTTHAVFEQPGGGPAAPEPLKNRAHRQRAVHRNSAERLRRFQRQHHQRNQPGHTIPGARRDTHSDTDGATQRDTNTHGQRITQPHTASFGITHTRCIAAAIAQPATGGAFGDALGQLE